MPGKKNITILKTETAKKILAKKDAGSSSGVGRTGAKATVKNPTPVYGQPQLIKIVEEADEEGGYYKIKPVVRDVTGSAAEDHTWFDPELTDDMYGLEITGAAGIKEDDKKAYLAMPIVDSSGRILWAFSQGGGAAENRPWVVITSISSPGVYVGSSYDEPGGTLTEADISIKLKPVHDITPTNDFEVGWADFADVVTNSNGDKTYYINGFMLG